MAVMTSQLLDKPTTLETKPPVPSTDAMALDSDINGQTHNALVEEAAILSNNSAVAIAPPPATTNGDHHESAPELALPHVTSGISPTAAFKPDPPAATSDLATLSTDAIAPTVLPPSIEAPISDAGDEAIPTTSDAQPTQTTMEFEATPATQETSAMPTTQESAVDTPADPVDSKPDIGLPDRTGDAPSETSVGHAEAPAQEEASQPAADTEMVDAPASGKTRAREDDDEGEPLPKRAKVEDQPVPEQTPSAAPLNNGAIPTSSTTPAPAAPTATPKSSVDPLWPTFDSEPITPQQNTTLLQRVRNARKIKAAGPFNKPVDVVALNIPNYPEIVKEPMDLGTIENKLKGTEYKSVDAFLYDFNTMIRNCYTFNGREHAVSHLAADLERYVTNIFPAGVDRNSLGNGEQKKPKKPVIITERKETRRKSFAVPTPSTAATEKPASAVPLAAPASAAPTSAVAASPQDRFALQPDGTPTIRRDSTTQDGRPKRAIQKPKSKDLPYTVKPKQKKFQLELKFCEQILNEVRKKTYAAFVFPFLSPVDPVALNIPHYHNIIKKPMDLQTIDQKLHAGDYTTSKDFHSDFLLMLQNCYKFNPDGDAVNAMGKQLEELFKELWSKKDQWIEEHTPPSEPQSSGDEEDEEDAESSEEDEVDANQRDLAAIQQQIAELTSRAQTIIQSGMKRVSPKIKSEKKKKKAGKAGEKKRKSGGGSTKVGPIKVKKTKVTPLSFQQKQEISETIGTLDEVNMRKAVQIIRNGVPSLRGVNDEELEIDMDIIPDDVLRELYKFLRGTRPKEEKAELTDEEYEAAPKRTSSKGGSAKRKNKPMGKREQEESIKAIQRQLESFKNPGSPDDQSPPAQNNDSSSDDDGESESEEE